MISRSLSHIYQVSNDFIDITSPAKTLREEAALLPSDAPDRRELFQTAIQTFPTHSSTLTQTAHLVTNGTSCRWKPSTSSFHNLWEDSHIVCSSPHWQAIFLEEAIIHDTQQTEKVMADLSPLIIVDSTSNVIQMRNVPLEETFPYDAL
ncbi:unnamed protein product [Adineta ricciae]|uniref:Uncharacterized protein n=1 Tax=Adineta ricciae TaxID=249248 RepID=A0A815TSR0_ADIRI|nr:unnamed protein product [Adineta ricciae]CAF1510115.1 unnamed protein product [Adineta ricciae]